MVVVVDPPAGSPLQARQKSSLITSVDSADDDDSDCGCSKWVEAEEGGGLLLLGNVDYLNCPWSRTKGFYTKEADHKITDPISLCASPSLAGTVDTSSSYGGNNDDCSGKVTFEIQRRG